jgi:site-specific recombinase XerD
MPMAMKIKDAFQEFLDYSLLERCLEPTTIQWYKWSIRPFYKYLRYKLLESDITVLSTDNLRDFFVSQRLKGNSSKTILGMMEGLKSFCTFLVKRGYLQENPFRYLEKPKLARKLPDFLDEEEARELLQTCVNLKRYYKSRWHRNIAIIALFLFAGVRKKELLNLKLQDVNLERGYIKVSAKNKERLIPLNETVKDYIADYLKVRPKRKGVDNLFVSTNRKESALTQQGLYRLFKELKEKTNISKRITPQILRHTFCTLMLRNGVNLRDIQLLAGHSDISTTARFYLGCDDKQLRKAVEMNPLTY